VPGPTLTERTEELGRRLQELQVALESFRAVTDLALRNQDAQLADRLKAGERLEARTMEMEKKVSALEEKGRHLEKLSDRSWSMFQSMTISVLSIMAGAIVTLAVQLVIKK
jgi:hypothetical protein